MRACVRGTGGSKHSYGRLCCSPLTVAHNLFHDVGVETLYTDYSMGYTVRPMHILFRPCGLTLKKRKYRQRSSTAIMQTNSVQPASYFEHMSRAAAYRLPL